MKIAVVNGPNLNILGLREPEKYGQLSLSDIEKKVQEHADKNKISISFYQSNIEGEIINFLQENYKKIDHLIINPGAFTHTSIAIRDTILGLKISTIEVHLSNIYNRETFRQKSYISDIAIGVISGFGWYGYIMALSYLNELNSNK